MNTKWWSTCQKLNSTSKTKSKNEFYMYKLHCTLDSLLTTIFTWLNATASITLVSKISAATIQSRPPFNAGKWFLGHNQLWTLLSAANNWKAYNPVNTVHAIFFLVVFATENLKSVIWQDGRSSKCASAGFLDNSTYD